MEKASVGSATGGNLFSLYLGTYSKKSAYVSWTRQKVSDDNGNDNQREMTILLRLRLQYCCRFKKRVNDGFLSERVLFLSLHDK
jgi:hypothetical protein